MVRCITCNVFQMRQFCRIFNCLAWFVTIEFNACRDQTTRCTMMPFPLIIPLSIDYVWNSSVDGAISTPSYSYCIWNRYYQNHRSILPNFLLFAWFDTLEFNRLPCSNNKMCDDAVFADRFRYQLTMFGIRILMWLSRLLHAHIAYEIDTAKNIAAFFQISNCYHDFMRSNSIVCHVQTARSTMTRFSLVHSAINCLCLEFDYW